MEVTDLALALDAEDGASITHVSNAVSQIDDLSGNGRHFTSGAGLEPVWTGSELQFTSPTVLSRTGQGDMNLPPTGDWVLCMKMRFPHRDFTGFNEQIIRFHPHYDPISNNVMAKATGGQNLQTYITNQRIDHGGLFTDLQEHTFTIGRQAGVRFLRTDGVLRGTLPSTTAIGQPDYCQIGINRPAFNGSNFWMRRVAMFYGTASDSDIQKIEKWVETGKFLSGLVPMPLLMGI